MKTKDYEREQFDKVMNAIDAYMVDPDISDFDKKLAASNFIAWVVNQSCRTYLECRGMFEMAKENFIANEDGNFKAQDN
jgi:hypothetical protein